jgi:hypothetical protein
MRCWTALRVCPETLGRIAEFSEHEANGGKAQECDCLAIEILPIFGEPATAIEPSDRPLDDPAFWYELEADGIVGSLDDFDMEMRKNFCQGICEFRSLIPTVGKEFLQEGKLPEQRCHDQNAAVAVLDVGWMNDGVKQEA